MKKSNDKQPMQPKRLKLRKIDSKSHKGVKKTVEEAVDSESGEVIMYVTTIS